MYSKLGKWLLALVLIFFGAVLILQNLNIISLEISNVVWDSWPILFIIIGLSTFRPFEGSWKLGSFLIIFGTLLWLGNFNKIDFSFTDIWKLWPLILIYFGASMLFGKGNVTIVFDSTKPNGKNNKYDEDTNLNFDFNFSNIDDYEKKTAQSTTKRGTYNYHMKSKNRFVTSVNFSKENWEVQDIDMWTGVGDLYFDFSKAYIPNRETTIRLKGYVADIQMKLPDNVAYKIYARVNIGEVQLFDDTRSGLNNVIEFISDDYDLATRKLNIYMNYQVGDITVLSV